MDQVIARSGGRCELCSSDAGLAIFPVDAGVEGDPETSLHLCEVCGAAATGGTPEGAHWNCLRETIWSEVSAVQVLSYRLLSRSTDAWTAEVLEQAYLEEENLSWAQRGIEDEDAEGEQTVDSNGVVLVDGDSVTLIKDLAVKGAGFTAKRGTLVKNIRTGSDPTHIEGKVNKMAIMLKTCFLKKA
jgi:protein PhnA